MPNETGIRSKTMPILNMFMLPAVLAMAGWFWHTNETVANTVTGVRDVKAEISRIYDEGTKVLKSHLLEEARADAKFEGVQEKIGEISVNQKEMQSKMQEMLLMQRDLLNEVKRRSPTP